MGLGDTSWLNRHRGNRWRSVSALQRFALGGITNAAEAARGLLRRLPTLEYGVRFLAVYRPGIRHRLSRLFADTTFCGTEDCQY